MGAVVAAADDDFHEEGLGRGGCEDFGSDQAQGCDSQKNDAGTAPIQRGPSRSMLTEKSVNSEGFANPSAGFDSGAGRTAAVARRVAVVIRSILNTLAGCYKQGTARFAGMGADSTGSCPGEHHSTAGRNSAGAKPEGEVGPASWTHTEAGAPATGVGVGFEAEGAPRVDAWNAARAVASAAASPASTGGTSSAWCQH